MLDLHVAIPVINSGLIFTIGFWLYWERRHNRRDRKETRAVADQAASDAKSCADVLDRLEPTGRKRRALHVVRDENTGLHSWHFE